MKKLKKIISVLCVITMILTVCIVPVSAVTAVTVTFNNNGEITTRRMNSGDALPNPGVNELGEKFCGWYTDYVNWSASSMLTTVPSTDTTVYARYPSVILDFKNITTAFFSGSSYHKTGNMNVTVENEVLNMEFTGLANWGIKIPAYDVYYNVSTTGETKLYKMDLNGSYVIKFVKAAGSASPKLNVLSTNPNSDVMGSHGGGVYKYGPELSWQTEVTIANGNLTDANYSAILFRNEFAYTGILKLDKIIVTNNSVVPPTYAITMNNNGTITTQQLTLGDAMPYPGANELGEEFMGWYTDPVNWTASSKITNVPSRPVTVYARYPSVIINFNNDMTAGMNVKGKYINTWGTNLQLVNGALELKPYSNGHGFTIPAYDSTTFTPFVMNRTCTYNIKFYIKSEIADTSVDPIKMGVFFVDTANPYGSGLHSNNWNGRVLVSVTESNEYLEYSATLPANAAVNNVWYDSLVFATRDSVGNTTSSAQDNHYKLYIDKIIITKVGEEVSSNIEINGSTYTPTFVDNFDGTTLDNTKWNYAPEQERQNLGAYWDNDMVEVSGGALHLNTGWDSVNNRAISGAINSQHHFQTQAYGYWEARMKFPTTPTAFWGAFWLQSLHMTQVGNGGTDGAEIDIIESITNKYGTAQHNIHWDGYGTDHQQLGAKYVGQNLNIYDGNYHTFSLEWTETYYKFYIDGTCTLTVDENHEIWSEIVGTANDPAYIQLSTEFGVATGITEQLDASHTGQSVLVDYVKVYEKIS